MRRYLLAVIEGRKNRFLDKIVLLMLSILEIVYFILLTLKNLSFKVGIIKTHKLPCKVISVGNITTGGTGKTPAVESLAQMFKEKGKKVVVVSRGYGGKNKEPLVVSDGEQVLADVQEAGDEVYMMARHFKKIPIIICKDRYKAGKLAVEKFSPDIIILDDGFQHRQLERDIDIVSVSAMNPFGYMHLLPRGLLREPLFALKRADYFIISRADQVQEEKLKDIKEKLKKYNEQAEIFTSQYQPLFINSLTSETNNTYQVEELKGKKVLALSGIGNPTSFMKSLKELEAEVIDTIVYPDHYKYNEKDLMDIAVQAQLKEVDLVITTEKDAVKFTGDMLCQFRKLEVGIFTLGIEMKVREKMNLGNMIF